MSKIDGNSFRQILLYHLQQQQRGIEKSTNYLQKQLYLQSENNSYFLDLGNMHFYIQLPVSQQTGWEAKLHISKFVGNSKAVTKIKKRNRNSKIV